MPPPPSPRQGWKRRPRNLGKTGREDNNIFELPQQFSINPSFIVIDHDCLLVNNMSGKLQFLFSITASFILNNVLSPICKRRAQSELNKKPSRSSSSNANNGRKSSRFMNPTTTNREYRNLGRRFSVLYFSVRSP